MNHNFPTTALAETITGNASRQSYLTIKTLVPSHRRDDAFRAYAYFRWVDDSLDGSSLTGPQRREFLSSQQQLLAECLAGNPPRDLCAEEWLLVDLTQGELASEAGMRIYLQDMMDMMAFDVMRRGLRVDSKQLNWYSRCLATAVTEAVYTFMGDHCQAPRTSERYAAVDAAHIIHMLRDMVEDLEAGYVNIPIEILPGEHCEPGMLTQDRVRAWVKARIELAKRYFAAGDEYLRSIENPRCRIAGAWYATRFSGVIEAIEREGYILRRHYNDCKDHRLFLRMLYRGAKAVLPTSSRPAKTPQQPLHTAVDFHSGHLQHVNFLED